MRVQRQREINADQPKCFFSKMHITQSLKVLIRMAASDTQVLCALKETFNPAEFTVNILNDLPNSHDNALLINFRVSAMCRHNVYEYQK